ncbi:MAG: hypothetical protein QOD06_2654, partial [Candidatus Binatota bacterium]|nr:hypothetical protein [Candidatus Binatota bacterium]
MTLVLHLEGAPKMPLAVIVLVCLLVLPATP